MKTQGVFLIFIVLLSFSVFGETNKRQVQFIVPVGASATNTKDTIVSFFIRNPSTVAQTVTFNIGTKGEFYFSKTSTIGGTTSTIQGTNILTCDAGINPTNCSFASGFQSFAPGESRDFAIRVRRTTNNINYPKDQGVFGTISVQESTGFIVATGNFMQEAYNAVAYFGGAFNINAGRPF